MTFPLTNTPFLPPNIIVPDDPQLFKAWINRLYEDISYAVNFKDDNYYPMSITSTASSIVNLPNFGAYIICVGGVDSALPTLTASLCKSSSSASGSIVTLGSQVGTGSWAGFALTISSTSTNFQIAHNNTGVTGNFNIRLIGTQ